MEGNLHLKAVSAPSGIGITEEVKSPRCRSKRIVREFVPNLRQLEISKRRNPRTRRALYSIGKVA
jgi:hypothetical protein